MAAWKNDFGHLFGFSAHKPPACNFPGIAEVAQATSNFTLLTRQISTKQWSPLLLDFSSSTYSSSRHGMPLFSSLPQLMR